MSILNQTRQLQRHVRLQMAGPVKAQDDCGCAKELRLHDDITPFRKFRGVLSRPV